MLHVKGALHLTPAEPPSPDASPVKAVDPTALINSMWNYGASFWPVAPAHDTHLPPAQAELVAQSLGEPARAPAPRSERERETAAERAKGQLWVMGNVAPAAKAPIEPVAAAPGVARPSPRGRQRAKGLDSVREVVSVYGSPPRPSAAPAQLTEAEEIKKLHGHGGRRANGSEHDAITYHVVATSSPAAAAAAVTPPKRETGLLKARKSSRPKEAPDAVVAPKPAPALVAPTPRRAPAPVNVLHAEPTLAAPTAQRGVPARINTALPHAPPQRISSPPLSRSANAQRTSFESQRPSAGGRASPAPSFDAPSIAASWGRSATPPVVAELADKACHSRKKERRAWKDEVVSGFRVCAAR